MSVTNIELWNTLAAEITRRDEDGRIQPVPNARATVTCNLLAHARQPKVAGLVRGYMEVAFRLEKIGASKASGAILCGIADAQPLLPDLTVESFEAIEAESRNIAGVPTKKAAPVYDEARPVGSVKLLSFLSPGDQRRG